MFRVEITTLDKKKGICHFVNCNTKFKMTMGKIKKSTLIGILLAAIVCIGVCWGVSYFIDHINGNTKAQIEARKRANEAADKTTKELNKAAQWYNDELNK